MQNLRRSGTLSFLDQQELLRWRTQPNLVIILVLRTFLELSCIRNREYVIVLKPIRL